EGTAARFADERVAALDKTFDADRNLARRVWAVVTDAKPLVVREYAAPRPGARDPHDPGPDDPDTVLWQPLLVLPADGKATVRFRRPCGVAVLLIAALPAAASAQVGVGVGAGVGPGWGGPGGWYGPGGPMWTYPGLPGGPYAPGISPFYGGGWGGWGGFRGAT